MSDPAKRHRRLVALVSGAAFLDFLDVTVVNLAFPQLREEFAGASVSDLAWVITAYAVAFAALLTAAGRLADVLGRRRVFLLGLALFTAASLASGLAPSLGVLIGARFVQGAGAALILPSGLGIVLAESRPEQRAAALGVWAAAAGAAAAFGPTVGGILVDAISWRAVFWINVPTGIAMVLAGRRLIREIECEDARLPDLVGTAAFAAGVGLVVLGVTKASDWGWSSVAVVASLGGGIALTAFAIARSFRHPAPAIETSLWRVRAFSLSNVSSFFFGSAVFAQMLVCILFLTGVWRYSELEAGLAMSPGAVIAAVAAAITGRLVEERGQRYAVAGGALLLAGVDVWLVAILGVQPNFLGVWLPANILAGVAMGIAAVGLSSSAALSAAPERYAAATGLSMTARQVGGALGVGALAAILEPQLPATGAGPFTDVFTFCAIGALLAAAAGSLIRLRAGATPPAGRPADSASGSEGAPAPAGAAAAVRP